MVKKVKSSLHRWDARQLSLASRVTIAQLVLLSIPSYFMQSLRIPQGICDEIERIEDIWILEIGPLVNLIPANARSATDCCLKEMITEKGCWNLDLFRIWLPEDLIGRISSIQPPHPLVGLDKIAWTGTSSGCFSIKSAYHKEAWKLPWKVEVPQRVRFFLWLVLKQRLLTQAERLRRGVINDARCSVCGHGYEDVLHTIRDCDAAKKVWFRIIPSNKLNAFFLGNLQEWLEFNLKNHINIDWGKVDWTCFFGLFAWRIWKNCNIAFFQGVSWNIEEVVKGAYSWWIRTRTNRAIKINTGSALTGGVLRYQNGDWVLGFNRRIGICSIFEVEL
ncbi:hypothetical protein V6Z11_D01G236200 [Gossypium hirsutum]